MSKYEQVMDEHEAICPYCGFNHHVEGEDYSDDRRVEQCSKCGMKYYLNQEFTVTNYTDPDCILNDKEHKWDVYVANGFQFRHCMICDLLELDK